MPYRWPSTRTRRSGAAVVFFGLAPNVVRFLIVGRVTQLLGALYTYRIEQDWDHEQDWDDDAVQ